ncbi:MAG TPA: GNAT family N-acetyltransferase, partial [Actinomycetota bacterium]
LLAPFTPFVSEELYGNLAGTEAMPSVHMTDYPEADEAVIDPALDAAMAEARAVSSLGRTVRNDAKVKVRQPLARAVVHVHGDPEELRPLLDLVAEELNVKEVAFAESAEELGRWRAKPSYRDLGPKLGPKVKDVAAALAADDGTLAGALARGDEVEVAGHRLSTDDVDLVQETDSGWGVASEGGTTVALDLDVTPELRREGLARDLVRAIQDARKAAGLEVTDRIELWVEASGEAAEALAEHRGWIAGEVLAIVLEDGPGPGHGHRSAAQVGGTVSLTLSKAR